MFNDKSILITGGTGSLGTALCKHFQNDPPKRLIIFSTDWKKQEDLRNSLGNPPYMRWFIGNIRDSERLNMAFEDVDYVIHAAAIKSLDACEKEPEEALKTNVIGTQNVISAALDRGVRKVLLISTDKAVNPINTYGTCKAMAEKLIINANNYIGWKNIKFSVVRYGNVVGSSNSVVPIWKKLIEQGATELPITDENMTRFWFPMVDAVRFVINSLEKMQGREIFIPKIKSIKITDLAAAFGMPYKVIGIRKGEKLHEELDQGYNSRDNEYLTAEEIRETIMEVL
jgi:UDP-N-acetylglucosamine 4,6-dehydratase